jgi:hypothetical protein
MMKDMHTKIFKRVTDFLLEAGPGLGLGIFVSIYIILIHYLSF